MITIKRALRTDLIGIIEIQQRAWLSEAAIYGREHVPALAETLQQAESAFDETVFLKATDSCGTLAGSIRVGCSRNLALIGRLSVDPQYQRQGIGAALLHAAEQVFPNAMEAELFTGSASHSNIRLYLRSGYQIVEERSVAPNLAIVYFRKNLGR